MRRVMIVFGVLASGTALSFGAAAAVFLANPNSRMVPNNTGVGSVIAPGGPFKGIAEPVPVPMPMPAVDLPANVDGKGALPPDEVQVEFGTLGDWKALEVVEADLPRQASP